MRFRHWWYQLAGWVRRVCKSGLAGVSSYRREILNPVLYSGAEGFEESAGAFARAAVLKDGAARHEHLGASAHDVCDCVAMDAAVYFNAQIEPARLADLRQELHLFYRRRDKALTPKTGIHAHHKNMRNQKKNLVR